MGMVVRTNMAALNANNALGQASKAQQNGMQKLASGFKINKAADDASGLAISEKMKNQIKALDTAKDNCEDGANMIQTAEGYMAETHEILNRMVELAEKSANGTLGKEDRKSLQDEMDQLCGEIDRIATTANFNGHKLLDGSIGSQGYVKITSDSGKAIKAEFNDFSNDYKLKVLASNIGTSAAKIESTTGDFGTTGDARANRLQIGESSTQADKLDVKINSFHTDSLFAGIEGFQNKSNNKTDDSADTKAHIISNNGTGANASDSSTYTNAVTIDISGKYNNGKKGAGDIDDLTDTDIQGMASAAADALRQVSTYVSDERGKLGAQQNRLEHTVNNLTTASENTTAANSRIRDTDMAKEMMTYTSKNIIAQAAQSMLAQANSQPQNVLSLLQ